MKENFNGYPDILNYLKINDKSQDTKVLNLGKCNFCFYLDLEILFSTLEEKRYDFTYLSFKDSDFQNSVILSLTNQKPIKDKNTNLTVYEYLKTKIDFTLDFRGCHFFDTVEISGVDFCKDLNFIDSIFECKVEFSELIFNGCMRLFGALFIADATFAHLELNHKSILFTNKDNRTKFEGNLYFSNVNFKEAKFWDFVFLNDVYFINTSFNCPALFNNSKFLGKTVITSIETIGLTEFNNKVYFDNAEINDLSLINIVFEKVISFNYATK